jgi:hypothetical protein
MSSKMQIWNMALSHLGISKEVASETEQTIEAKACRRFYETTVKNVLKDHSWPFASKIATLNLIETSPNTEWAYSYRYPTDCLFFRRILSGNRNDTPATKVAYAISQDASAGVIFTDATNAVAEYTRNITDESFFPSDFETAVSYRLANYIAARVTAGDPFGLAKMAFQNYQIELSRAVANSFNEDQSVELQDTESVNARN